MKTTSQGTTELREMLANMVAEAKDLEHAAGGSVTDAVAAWLAPQYLLAAKEKLDSMSGAGRFDVIRTFVQDWALLRRGDHAAARLKLDREHLDWERANSKALKEQEFCEWLQRPEVRKKYLPDHKPGLTPEALELIEKTLHLM